MSDDTVMAIKVEMIPKELNKSGTIHSGHFMVSQVHDDVNNEDAEEEAVSPFSDDQKGFNFANASRETQQSYNFGNQTIDSSLTKLFQCMTLAYSGTISSPRWKQFRGLHVTQKERIRLNNLIWREWHLQYIYHKSPMVCQFATPLSDDIHCRPEAVVLEGKYWKRRLDTVTAEYKKCRRYFKERISDLHLLDYGQWRQTSESELLEKVKDVTFLPRSSKYQMSSTDLNVVNQADITMEMDFTNELFATLNQPFAFPNPRELNQLGYSEFIQPGLVQLQPNLEEFMDIDTMQDLLNTKIPSSSVFTDPSISQIEMNPVLQASDSTGLSLVDFLTNGSGSNGSNNIADSTTPVAMLQGTNSILPTTHIISQRPPLFLHQQQQQQQHHHPQTIMNTPLLQQQQQQIINSPSGNITLQLANNNGINSVDPAAMSILRGQLGGNLTIMPQGLTVSPPPQQQFVVSTQSLTLTPQQTVALMSNIPNLYSGNTATIAEGCVLGSLDLNSTSSSPSISSLPTNNNNNNKISVSLKNPSAISQILQQHNRQIHLPPIQPKPEPQLSQAASSLTALLQQQSKHSIQNSPIAQALANSGGMLNLQQHQQQQLSPLVQMRKPPKGKNSGISCNSSRQQGLSNPNVPTNASGMITDLAALAQLNSGKKQDGLFAVPSVAPRKPRNIAPAPASPVPQPPPPPQQPSSESYLAQLLKKGTYPGAVINVKKEPHVPVTPALSPHTAIPAQTAPKATSLSNQLPLLTQQLLSPTATSTAFMSPTLLDQGHGQRTAATVPVATSIVEAPPNVIDLTNMSQKDLNTLLNALSPQTKSQSISPSNSSFTSDIKVMSSPINVDASSSSSSSPPILPQSPVTVKRSPSPTMDTTGELSEPSSPFASMPTSPCASEESLQTGDSPFLRESKKAAHLSAEQKRRFNLKMGFDLLQKLVPSLSRNPRVSKATMLQKTASYCKKLKVERSQMRMEATVLKQEIESLNGAISNVQSQLPETGVPVTRQRKDQMKEMFDEYIRTRTMDNWKFWIFSVIMSCLYESYCNTVSTTSLEEMCRTSLTWLDQSCSLVSLRPNVLNALRKLSTTTSILTEPEKVREEAIQNISKLTNPRGRMSFL